MDLTRWIDDNEEAIVTTYKYLHTIPELGHKEFKTAAFLAEELRKAGLEVEEKVDGTTGIIATLKGQEPGLTFAMRADMDALPITEETGLPFSSTHPGCMHACGHDGNSTMVLWAAKALAQRGIKKGTVKFVFQPAEEVLSGARSMIASGKLKGIEEMVTIHFRTKAEVPFGEACPGISHSAACPLKVTIHGQAAHGSRPHLGVNVAEVAGLVTHAVGLVHCDPRVAHSAKPTRLVVDTGTFNIIPDKAVMNFDLRSQTNEVMDFQLERVIKAIEKCAEAMGATVEIEQIGRIPGGELDEKLVEETAAAITGVLGKSLPKIFVPGSEDFHCYAVEAGIRATVIGLGSDAERNHSSTVTYKLEALPIGVKILTALAAGKLG